MLPPLSTEQVIERTVREEWGRILASLVNGLNDLQLAEDCLQEAVISALDYWGKNGLPRSPSAWLITVARRWINCAAPKTLHAKKTKSPICWSWKTAPWTIL